MYLFCKANAGHNACCCKKMQRLANNVLFMLLKSIGVIMSHTNKRLKLAMVLSVFIIFATPPAFSADFSEGTANFSGYFNNKALFTDASLLLPLYEMPQNAAFFVNPSIGFSMQMSGGSKHEERFSFGLGNRLYLPGEQFQGMMGGLFNKGIIFGGNWYLDLQYSMYDNFFTKTGGGVEVLSDWVDARFNGYIGLTDERDLGKRVSRRDFYGTSTYAGSGSDYETLMPGFDAEIGVRLPVIDQLGEMRVFAGGYYFDARHVKDIKGIKSRFEWAPIPFLSLGAAWYSNKHLHGEKWQAQLAVKLPFSMNALQSGRNPFSVDYTPKTGNLWKDRYTTPVRRNGL